MTLQVYCVNIWAMKAGLNRNRVLATARELVQREGLQALSMRRLGELLGVEAMALYRHVRNKDDLLDALRDDVIAPVATTRKRSSWQAEIRGLARASRAALLAAPALAPLFAQRPALTTATLPLAERAITALARAGVPPRRLLGTYESLLAFVIGHVLLELGLAMHGAPAVTLDPDHHPTLSRLSRAIEGHSAEASFECGLDLFLHGIAATM